MSDPVRVLLDVGIEQVPPDRAIELASILTRWAEQREAELAQMLAECGFDAVVRSQAADYER